MGALRSFFVGCGRTAPIFHLDVSFMKIKSRRLAHGAIIAALYVLLTHMQNMLLPGSATWAIQLRLSEALCVLAFFTPAAIPGLAVGCLVFNLTFAAALPLDWLVGSLATFCAAWTMYLLRQAKIFGLPLVGLLMPALSNAILVGWELTVYIGGAFPVNALYVAIGEAVVLMTFGSLLYQAITKRNLQSRLFG